ncbi:low specificity L-threonine aldolase [Parasphingopyxis sp. CP4]|uniref:threonine aldolase family protein n=1 Tax=Parasphingopyxis sp. CP4 TaxID=2724527 RepID=UPI0015A29AEC|nr:beta-eliminating lyase-related protein [Parasphingopyxis sp. CP4]QLC23010.1 low specificity L-threonine aldolase [Parasphingopyxis sp. CP4]
MRFFSDNAAAVSQPVLDALANANSVDTAYDDDALSQRLDAAFSELFESDVTALWVSTGTAANALALAALCPPHGSIICHREAHIQNDECGAPEFYTHGAKLLLGEGEGAKLAPAEIERLAASIRDDVHQMQIGALSITQASEYGMVYQPDEVRALADICHAKGWSLHMDGARFANAVAHLDCAPADISWRVGVDMLSFGCVKNGGMSAEAMILFGDAREKAAEIRYRRKRGGHLLSKGRYLAAQLMAMLTDDLWLANARAANAGAKLIADAAPDRLVYPAEANEVFITLSADEAASLRAAGFDFYDWGIGEARFVTSWDQREEDIRPLAAAIAAL